MQLAGLIWLLPGDEWGKPMVPFVPVILLCLFLVMAGGWIIRSPARPCGSRPVRIACLVSSLLICVLLAASGRLAVALAGLILVAPWLFSFLRTWWGESEHDRASRKESSSSASSPMDRAEALQILDLPANPSRESVQSAYLRLIHKLHPDRGGSAYLAARLNEARQVLLKG
ncbi:hypothetical protein AY555_00695 [Haematospirillum jordaniae]|uniref:J domain-containing protein n=1 Tax=Haematospirillum jordaniae TaxID=1549855 RepID=A0A143DB45_9PROT|nr:hypothetical protein AY555_00695 [Haematospirillum jordaniae]